MAYKEIKNAQLIGVLKSGRIAVIPTDTIYGIVGNALLRQTVEKIYELRKRKKTKPMIVLISDIPDLKKFSIKLSDEDKEILQKIWPGKVSVVLDCRQKKFQYLHRGKKTIAFRVPALKRLRNLLKKVGPLIAPSANTEKGRPATTIREARKYFGNGVDLYEDGGKLSGSASTLIQLKKGKIKMLRKRTDGGLSKLIG